MVIVVVVARDSLARMRDWKGKKRRLKINKKPKERINILARPSLVAALVKVELR